MITHWAQVYRDRARIPWALALVMDHLLPRWVLKNPRPFETSRSEKKLLNSKKSWKQLPMQRQSYPSFDVLMPLQVWNKPEWMDFNIPVIHQIFVHASWMVGCFTIWLEWLYRRYQPYNHTVAVCLSWMPRYHRSKWEGAFQEGLTCRLTMVGRPIWWPGSRPKSLSDA